MRRVLDPGTLRAAWTLLALAGTLTLIYRLRTVLLLLVFSVVFAYLIFPLVKLAERGLPVARRRPLAIALVYLVLVAVLSTLAALVGPRLGHELAALGEKVPINGAPHASSI
jgi:predicted PurR-regulated permease PerM